MPVDGWRNASIILMIIHQCVAYALYVTPVFFMWEKLVHTHDKPLWIRLPSRLPVGQLSFFAMELLQLPEQNPLTPLPPPLVPCPSPLVWGFLCVCMYTAPCNDRIPPLFCSCTPYRLLRLCSCLMVMLEIFASVLSFEHWLCIRHPCPELVLCTMVHITCRWCI